MNKASSPREKAELKSALLAGARAIGLLQAKPEEWLKTGGGGNESWISERIAAREAARKSRNFGEADRIRAELEAAGVVLEDRPGGKTEWRRAG